MLISTKGRYALRVMLDLAQLKSPVPVSLRSIAERQHLSLKYTETIVASLCKAGLIEGTRGKGGGYRLTRRLRDYPVGEILRLAEGSLSPVAELENPSDGKETAEALSLPLWDHLDRVIGDYLDRVTLRDVLHGKVSGSGK